MTIPVTGYVRSERDKLIAALTQACQCMTLEEINYLLEQARELNAIHCPATREH